MIDIIRLTVVLTFISCGAALLIAVTNVKTRDRIEHQQMKVQNEALKKIMPDGVAISEKKFVLPTNDTLPYWTGVLGDDTVFTLKVGNRGYSSQIYFLVCTSTEGKILGMTILEQHETPGLGAREQEKLSKKYIWNSLFGAAEQIDPWFSEQFEGVSINRPILIERTIGEWHSLNNEERSDLLDRNGITAITGSTISTRAITEGLNNKAKSYLKAIRGN